MNPRRLLLSFLLLFPCLPGWAQKFSTKFFNSKDGLPQSQVLSIAEDKLGYLWVGTYGGGLARFDGKHFSVYTEEDGMRDNYVHKIYVDSRNNIWAGTAKGLSKFDGKKFTSYKELTGVFTQMVEFNDTLFAVGRDFKLSKIVNDSICCVDCAIHGKKKIQFLASSTSDCFYFMQDSLLLHRRDRLGDQAMDVSTLGKVYNIFPIGDSVTIISAKGAFQWSKQKLRLVDSRINTPLILADENLITLWSRNDAGVVKVTNNFPGFTAENIKMDAMATDAFNDAEGNTWIGTSGSGLMKYFVKDFEFLGNPITVSMLKSNGKLWVATRFQGVNIYSEDNRLKKNIPMESLGRRLKALREDKDGSIWVAAASDIARIDKDTYHVNRFTSQNGLKNATINNIETAPSQKLWVSYRGQGLQFWDGKRFKDFSMNHQLSSMDVLGMKYIPYGDRLMVCTSNGVDEVKNGKVSRLKIPEFYKTPVLCAAPYKTKYVIFGTDGKGLCLYNLDNSSVTYYSKKHGLKSGLIFFVSADEKGYVWIGSNVGIEKIKFNEKLEIEEHYYFSDANGLNGLETNVNASFISGDDKYFGLIDGLYHFSTSSVTPPIDFELHFTNVELLNSSYSLSAYATDRYGFYKVPLNPQLPHDKNSIEFSFSKVSKKYPESTEYKFMLEGLEKEWSMLTVEEEVRYKDLPPGEYNFKVMASDFSGKWTNPYLEYPFTIAPPFYKTTLFLVSSFLLLVLFIVLLVYYRIRRTMVHALALEEVKAKEIIRLRKEIGRDFHDELGNQLARIVNYISLIKMKGGENMEMLTMVEESAKNLIGGTRDFIWALDHENDSLSNLFVNLKDFGDRLFSEKNIEFRAFHSIEQDTKLPMGYTRQINLIVKESMTNCFKHANATRVDLDFKELLSNVRISLKDNGIGISAEKEFSNGGISNIRHRAERISSQFEIISNGQGTEITLQLNFKP